MFSGIILDEIPINTLQARYIAFIIGRYNIELHKYKTANKLKDRLKNISINFGNLKNKKFFSESLSRRKRTFKQKALDLQKKNKEYARQVKEERKYLKGS